jgi:hypothetical protein
MRRELIAALSFPQSVVLEIISQRDCPEQSLFNATNKQCLQCGLKRECHWASCLDDFSDFDGKATKTINASLRYGIDLVARIHIDLTHDQKTCECESCTWVRDAELLTEAFDDRFATNRYRQLY